MGTTGAFPRLLPSDLSCGRCRRARGTTRPGFSAPTNSSWACFHGPDSLSPPEAPVSMPWPRGGRTSASMDLGLKGSAVRGHRVCPHSALEERGACVNMSTRALRHPYLQAVLGAPLSGCFRGNSLGLRGWLAACKPMLWAPLAVCPWANNTPSLSPRFLVAMGCEDFLG